jgi:hypothetical protein
MQKQDFQRAFENCIVVGRREKQSVVNHCRFQADDLAETTRRQRAINSRHADFLFNEKK